MGAVAMKETSTGLVDRGYPVTEATLYIYCDECGSFNVYTYIPFTKYLVIAIIIMMGVLLTIKDAQWLMCIIPLGGLASFLPWKDIMLRYKCGKCGNDHITDYNSLNYQSYDLSVIDVPDYMTQKRYIDTDVLHFQQFTSKDVYPPQVANGINKKCSENTPKRADTFTKNTPVNALAVIPVDTAKVASLISDLKNSSAIESEAAAEEMKKIGVVAIEPLIARLQDSNWTVRASRALALGQIGDARAVEALVVALKDSEVWVRISAAISLGQIKDARAVEALITAISDSDSGVREEAARALGQIGDVRAFEPLLAALKDSDVYARSDAVYALGEIKDARAIEPLGAFLKDNNRDVRENAAYALGKIGDARAIESLIFSLLDPDKFVRVAVTEALGQIGDSRAVEPLRATANNDDEPIVRSYAQTAINRIWDPDVWSNDDD